MLSKDTKGKYLNFVSKWKDTLKRSKMKYFSFSYQTVDYNVVGDDANKMPI